MKGIVVEIATLINAPPHHTTRATPDTLQSGTSNSNIGISITLTMGNNWFMAYHTMHLKRPFLHLLLIKIAVLPHFH